MEPLSDEVKTLDQEFEAQPIYTKKDLAIELPLLDKAYKHKKEKIRERYLSSKKVVNLDGNGNIKSVVLSEINLYKKYSEIYSVWQNIQSRKS